MNKLFVIMTALALASCGSSPSPKHQESDMNHIQQSLPEGCSLHYAGEVHVAGSVRPSRIFYTICGNVTTTSGTYWAGKYNYSNNAVTIGIKQ